MRYAARWASLASLLSLTALLSSSTAFAIAVKTGTEDVTLNVDANLQLRGEATWGGPPPTTTSGPAPSGHFNTDFFLRRASLSIRGTAYKYFWYYLKLESGKFGARGNYSVQSLLQDVVIGFVPVQEFYIEGGFLKTPLSRPALDSSWRNNSLEGVSDILLYPNTRAQRQMGVQIRGLFFDRLVLLRGGLYEGARTGVSGGNPVTSPPPPPVINPNGSPLYAGMARVNLVGFDNGYTYPGIHLDGTSRVSLGIGGQYQPRSGAVKTDGGGVNDYFVYAADGYADIALSGDKEAVVILDGYHFDYGDGASKTGNGLHGELGFRWWHIEPYVSFYWFNSVTKVNSFFRSAGGLTYFIKGNHAKIQAEYQSTIANGTLPNTPGHAATPWLHQVLLQVQLTL
jgi:hypothetical protein